MTEIIYLDIDGTLRDEAHGIPYSAIWAVNECRKNNIKIVICTGRNPGSVQDDVRALNTDGIISGGGCYIRYNEKLLWKKHFEMDTIEKVIKTAKAMGLSLALEAEQKIYMDHGASKFYEKDFQHKIYSEGIVGQEDIRVKHKITYEDNLNELKKEPYLIHKICILGQQKAVISIERELIEEAEVIQRKEWNTKWYLELLPKGCDKGSAVKWLNRELGIERSNTMSFGDSENDIAMMKETEIAIAVGGSTSIEKYASAVCEAVTEDGIYKELVRRGIIKPCNTGRSAANE